MNQQTGPARRLVRWCVDDIRSGETFDLWILIASAVGFTLLGAFGIAKVQVLSSVVLALLAVLAISQLRGRNEVRDLVRTWHQERTSIFEKDFPPAYYAARARASRTFEFSGLTMSRTLPTIRPDLERILANGGRVRIVLPNPGCPELMEMVAASRRYGATAREAAAQIEHSIAAARQVSSAGGRTPEIRLTTSLPRVGLNLVDIDHPDGLAMVQMYQTNPAGEAAPIFVLSPSDDPWYERFSLDFEALWDRSEPV